MTSDSVKSMLDWLSAKVMVAVWPVLRLSLSVLRVMVGGLTGGTLTARLTALLASAPSWLKLPAASLKRLLETTTAAVCAPAVAAKVAV